MNELVGQGFILRKWKRSDAESLCKHADNENIAVNLRDGFPHPYTMKDADKWLEMVLGNTRDLIYAIEVSGEACGGIGLHGGKDVYRYNAEIGYWLSEKHWGKGISTQAVALLVDEGFTNYDWIRIYAGVFSSNPASMRVLEKNGFREEAVFRKSVKKRGVFLDEHIWAKYRDE